MGYSIIPGTVSANRALLEAIHRAVQEGVSLTLECESSRVSAERYKIHGILKAAEILTSECEGKYATLREKVKVFVRNQDGKAVVVCEPRVKPSELRVRREDENDAVEKIEQLPGTIARIAFYPSEEFNEEAFGKRVEAKGWKLHTQAKEVEEDGRVIYGVTKIETPKTKEAMSALGFGRARREGVAGASEAEEGRND